MRHSTQTIKAVKSNYKKLGVKATAQQYDIAASTIYTWVRKWKKDKTVKKSATKKKTRKH